MSAPSLFGMNPRLVIVILVAAMFGLYFATLTDGIDATSTDWAMYVMHARNILNGRPYSETGYVQQPEIPYMGSNSYPSGYPLLLLPVYAVAGFNVRAFKILSDLALALSLLPIFFYARRYLSPLSALLVVLALGFGAQYVGGHDNIASDGPFQAVSYAAILLLLWIYDGSKDVSGGWRWGVPAGAMIALGYLIRPVGMALLVAVVLYDLLRRRRVSSFLATAVGTLAVVLLANNFLFHKDAAYKDQFVYSPIAIAKHAVAYLGYISYVFQSPVSNVFRYLMWIPSMILALVGLWEIIKRRSLTVVEFYWPVMAGVLCLYWIPNSRYLMPILPVYLVYMFIGARVLLDKVPEPRRLAAAIAATVLLFLAPAANVIHYKSYKTPSLIGSAEFDQMCQEVKARTGDSDSLIFWNPRVMALYTGRHWSPYPFSSQADVAKYMNRVGPRFVVVDKQWEDDQKFLIPAIAAEPDRYHTVYENARFEIVKADR